MRPTLMRLILPLALCFGSGCAYFAATPPLDLADAEVHATQDVPVPQGFVMDKSASHKHERDGFRRYQLVYRRTEYLSEERVREFVQQTYTRAGWKLRFLWGLEESNFLFVRGAEECEVRVSEDFGDRFTTLQVWVRPRETPDGSLVAAKSLQDSGRDEGGTQGSMPASSARGRN